MRRTPTPAAGRPGRTWHSIPRRPSRLPLCLALAAALSQTGCVALSIPSERFHDATDAGGIFGPWQSPDRADHHAAPNPCAGSAAGPIPAGPEVRENSQFQHHSEFRDNSGFQGGFAFQDGVEIEPESGHEPQHGDVPWPRFHPVPTRPVFGTPSL